MDIAVTQKRKQGYRGQQLTNGETQLRFSSLKASQGRDQASSMLCPAGAPGHALMSAGDADAPTSQAR